MMLFFAMITRDEWDDENDRVVDIMCDECRIECSMLDDAVVLYSVWRGSREVEMESEYMRERHLNSL